MASHSSRATKLRIPSALAVAVVGTSASLAFAFAGCDDSTPTLEAPPIADGADSADAGVDAGPGGSLVDAAMVADAAVDARPDAPLDAPPDARPDAPVA